MKQYLLFLCLITALPLFSLEAAGRGGFHDEGFEDSFRSSEFGKFVAILNSILEPTKFAVVNDSDAEGERELLLYASGLIPNEIEIILGNLSLEAKNHLGIVILNDHFEKTKNLLLKAYDDEVNPIEQEIILTTASMYAQGIQFLKGKPSYEPAFHEQNSLYYLRTTILNITEIALKKYKYKD